MAASASFFGLSRRGTRLMLCGCIIVVGLYSMSVVVSDILQAANQIEDLKQSYGATAKGSESIPSNEGMRPSSSGAAPSLPGLIASDKAAATALIQQALQKSVELPAKLESLHILDAPDHKGLISVRASIRILDLAPERVVAFIRKIETTMPAIVFDDIRISIRTQPGAFGSSGFSPSMETRSAEIVGIVQAYAMSTTEPASNPTRENVP